MPGGRVLDPRVEAPWPAMIEHRHRLREDTSLSAEARERIGLFLKITANAGAYGIHAEYNRQDMPTGQRSVVTVHSLDERPFTARVAGPEDPGTFSCPPLAAVTTGAARLMLAMLERCVTDLGGAWAFADTDSMAIVATEHGGLAPCPGGAHRDQEGHECVRALSHREVEGIRDRFAALNPYHPDAIPGSILKHELDAYCFAVAAKRYALYRYDNQGAPRLVPASEHQPCSHGLGHLLNPTDPDSEDRDWIVQFWEDHLASRRIGESSAVRDWAGHPALGKIAITSPTTWRQLDHYNKGKPYRDKIKPFGFLLHAPGAEIPGADGGDGGRLVAPYTHDPRKWQALDWINLTNPDHPVKITTDPTRPGRALVDAYAAIADTYFTHPEAKAADPSGAPAGRASRGLLHRRHVLADSVTIIGKEANDLDDRVAGLTPDPDGDPPVTIYPARPAGALDAANLDRLRRIGPTRLAALTGMSERRLRDILRGRATPRAATRQKLIAALGETATYASQSATR